MKNKSIYFVRNNIKQIIIKEKKEKINKKWILSCNIRIMNRKNIRKRKIIIIYILIYMK